MAWPAHVSVRRWPGTADDPRRSGENEARRRKTASVEGFGSQPSGRDSSRPVPGDRHRRRLHVQVFVTERSGFHTTQMARWVSIPRTAATTIGRRPPSSSARSRRRAVCRVTSATAISTMPLWGRRHRPRSTRCPETEHGSARPGQWTGLLREHGDSGVARTAFARPMTRRRHVWRSSTTCRRYWPGGDAIAPVSSRWHVEGPRIEVVIALTSTSSSRHGMPCGRFAAAAWLDGAAGANQRRLATAVRCASWCTRSIPSAVFESQTIKSSMRRARPGFEGRHRDDQRDWRDERS